jgi:transposase-like protein
MAKYLAALRMDEAIEELKDFGYQEEGWESVWDHGRGALKGVLEEQMQAHRQDYLRVLWAQGGVDRCNGHYRRQLLTSMGAIELEIPRTRRFSARGVLTRYARRERRVDQMILACFVLGLSTRKVGEALLPILGERVSASTVSRVAQTLDRAVAGFHRRRLADRYRVLLLDGVVLKNRTGVGSQKRIVLTAMGITKEKKKEILDFRIASSESEAEWNAFLTNLYSRGLLGEKLETVVVDGGAGLAAALPLVYPNLPLQRCWAHKVRNITNKLRKKDHKKAKQGLRRVYDAKNLRAARSAAGRFARKWEKTAPSAVRCLWKDLEELLVFFRFKESSWRRMTRTTNAIERRFREVKRRTRPMGVFADRSSMERILYAVFTYENKKEGTGTPFLLTQYS